ncbi:hypothetical protein MHW47_04625, partial [Streptomyces sp. OfavH-34-F]|nr:hypothetical protein [Streptomyces sp. OfavH-34-F]
MRRLVVVEACACPFPGVLRARWGGTSFSVRLGPVHRGGRASVVDEHLVVDTDVCRDASLLGCGDVLQGSRAYSAAAGLRRLAGLLAAHPGCALAAVPLAGGV